MRVVSPFGALLRGLAAGAAGAAVQTQFMKSTAKIAPANPAGVFQPPEPQQQNEMSVETVARRFVEQFMQRGPLTESQRKLGGEIVHYSFGAAWGGIYGLLRESSAVTRHPAAVAGYGAVVWMVGDNVILPAFRLAAGPRAYPAKSHAYALAAHFAYGLGLAVAYEALRADAASAAIALAGLSTRLRRRRSRAARVAQVAARVSQPAIRFGAASGRRAAQAWVAVARP